ncbi:MAG: hypothetical protein ABI024_00300, partial [Vicinamibacterales bacterium]
MTSASRKPLVASWLLIDSRPAAAPCVAMTNPAIRAKIRIPMKDSPLMKRVAKLICIQAAAFMLFACAFSAPEMAP